MPSIILFISSEHVSIFIQGIFNQHKNWHRDTRGRIIGEVWEKGNDARADSLWWRLSKQTKNAKTSFAKT